MDKNLIEAEANKRYTTTGTKPEWRGFISGAEWLSKSQWIDVKDGLPEVGKYYQVAIGENILKALLVPHGWVLFSSFGLQLAKPENPVTHWQPLPSPPNS